MVGIDGEAAGVCMLISKSGSGVYESNMISGDNPLLWKKAPPEAGSKRCSVCKVSQSEVAYSGAQLKRQGQRRCKGCVAAGDAVPLSAPDGDRPLGPHTLVLMSIASETDRAPFMPRWAVGETPAAFTWLAPDAPASHTPPDAATLAARRAIVEPYFRSGPMAQGDVMLIDSSRPYFTAANAMRGERRWIKCEIVNK